MKVTHRILTGLAIFLCLGAALLGERERAAGAAGDDGAIRAVLASQAEAWNRGDLNGFLEGYWKSEQTTFVGSNGVFRGWEGLRERYLRSYPDRRAMGRLEFSGLEITMLAPDAALVLGHWQLEREADRPSGVFTLILRKFPNGWRIIHDHTSAMAKGGEARGGGLRTTVRSLHVAIHLLVLEFGSNKIYARI